MMYSSELPTANTDGCVLYMTDMSIMQHSANSSTIATSGHNECDSDTSGYMSTSSLDSTGEERRLTANADKIMTVWNCWSQNIDSSSGPKCSTPKRTSQRRVLKMRVNLKAGSRFFAQKSRSEGDLCRPEAWKPLDCNYAESLDSGLNILSSIQCKSYASQDWKRRPYMTQSTSEKDVQIDGNKSNHARLPRYRVTITGPTNHGAVSGLSVNESMTEFLSNVNQENLASYLQFYDRITRKANIESLGQNGSVYV